jgi:hypothetical protein
MVSYSNMLKKVSLTFGSVGTIRAMKLGFLPTFQSQMSEKCVLPPIYFTTVTASKSFHRHT